MTKHRTLAEKIERKGTMSMSKSELVECLYEFRNILESIQENNPIALLIARAIVEIEKN